MLTVFDIDKLKVEIEIKKNEALKPEVYTNPALASKVNKDLKVMEAKVDNLDRLTKQVNDMTEYIEMCELEGDDDIVKEIEYQIEKKKKSSDKIQ